MAYLKSKEYNAHRNTFLFVDKPSKQKRAREKMKMERGEREREGEKKKKKKPDIWWWLTVRVSNIDSRVYVNHIEMLLIETAAVVQRHQKIQEKNVKNMG